jgi:hypothetical protein
MRSHGSITDNRSQETELYKEQKSTRSRWLIAFVALIFFLASTIVAQRVAIIVPHKTDHDIAYSQRAEESFSSHLKVLDSSQSEVAFRSVRIRDVYNMDLGEAKTAASVIGCDYFVIIRTGIQRRSSFSRADYYEAFAVHYVVSGRTGELLSWLLKSFEADDQDKALRLLAASINNTSNEIVDKIRSAKISGRRAPIDVKIEEVPDAGSPAGIDLKPPIPYRRIKPEYTTAAFLYDVRATIDIEADVDSDGRITATRVVRWAGFGLEQSAENAVRGMSWRPAMRAGKPLPMRVLLRYNFTKVDKE